MSSRQLVYKIVAFPYYVPVRIYVVLFNNTKKLIVLPMSILLNIKYMQKQHTKKYWLHTYVDS